MNVTITIRGDVLEDREAGHVGHARRIIEEFAAQGRIDGHEQAVAWITREEPRDGHPAIAVVAAIIHGARIQWIDAK